MAPVLDGERELTARWLAQLLPFPLTGDQHAALAAIDDDLARARPMQRLLMGEVGSGKTVVALYALLRAVEHGYQGALMAPTETLAEQHFATLQALLPGELVPVGAAHRLDPGAPARRPARRSSPPASCRSIVGTHALIEASVEFARLAVAVVDEQHRFGVRQRAALDAKGCADRNPHVLHMTATPIPRTLALAGYGDLDFTVLRELPRGRRPIQTSRLLHRRGARPRLRADPRGAATPAGRPSSSARWSRSPRALQARAATAEFERLRTGELRDFRGRAAARPDAARREKQAAMAAFACRGGATCWWPPR